MPSIRFSAALYALWQFFWPLYHLGFLLQNELNFDPGTPLNLERILICSMKHHWQIISIDISPKEVYIYDFHLLWKGMDIRKSGNWRRSHPKLQYNVKFALITWVQRNLYERDPCRIDGHLGRSPLSFPRFGMHLTLVHQNKSNSYKKISTKSPHQGKFNNIYYIEFGDDLTKLWTYGFSPSCAHAWNNKK